MEESGKLWRQQCVYQNLSKWVGTDGSAVVTTTCHLVFALSVVFDTLTFCIPQLTTVNYILHVNETDSIFHPTHPFITPVKLYYISRSQHSFWAVASIYAFAVCRYESNYWEVLILSALNFRGRITL